MKVKHIKETLSIESPEWKGDGFVNPTAHKCWLGIPESLRRIVVNEIELGNDIARILRNNEREIIILSFKTAPRSGEPSDENIIIHTKHSYGNYCYDGTKCTYEEKKSGCFLSFEDQDYEEDDFS